MRMSKIYVGIILISLGLVLFVCGYTYAADRYGCTGKKLCADAHATCSGSTPENCGQVSFPTEVITCASGTAQHCDHSGDTIECGTWSPCYWDLQEKKCRPDIPYLILTIGACRAW